MTPTLTISSPFSARRPLPSLDQIRAEKARRHLKDFVRQAWSIVEKSPFVDGFHIDAICKYLEAVSRGQIRYLLINVPPRHSKSLLVSVFWPAWEWIDSPSERWLFSSYAQKLATRDSISCRRLIESDWYRRNWPKVRLVADQNEKQRFENTECGVRIATCTQAGTGEGGSRIAVDDPHAVDDSLDSILSTVSCWDTVMSSRMNDPKKDAALIIGQRVHEQDLSGHVLEQGGYEHLCIPAEYEPGRSKVTCLGWKDPRTEEGQLICEERFGREEVEALKAKLGTYAAAGQLQQRPAPAGGGMIKANWWRFYTTIPSRVDQRSFAPTSLPLFDEIMQSWDFTFKGNDKSDYVVGQLWGRQGINKYLLDQARGKWDFVQSISHIKEFTLRAEQSGYKSGAILIEEKANGAAIIAALRQQISGIIAINPTTSKESRVSAISPDIESGHVYLPDPKLNPWVNDFLAEFAGFPKGTHDDQVDACSQVLNRFRAQPVQFLTNGPW